MSNLNARQGRLKWALRDAELRVALLLKLTPMLLITMLAGCATKGEHASGLDHSSASGRGYNASVARASGSNASTADPSSASSIPDATGRRKTRRSGAGGVAGGSDEMNESATEGGPGNNGMAADDGMDDDQDSSLSDGSAGGHSGPGGSKRRGRSAGRAGSVSSDGTAGLDSATDGTGTDTIAGASGGAKGKRGATGRRRGGSGTPGSNENGFDMDGADDEDFATRIAAVEVPSGRVEVNEEYQPLTLGGALPVVLGVNEEGRFDFDQYALRDEVKVILDSLAVTLKAAEYDRLDIVGYTDRIGSVDYNQRLSELRAYAVAQYLIHKGVPQNKIRYEGRGDKDPLTHTDECRELSREDLITCLQRDRRVEIEASIHRKHATVQ